MPTQRPSWGARLQHLREELGASQQVIADRSGLSRALISNTERGHSKWQGDELWQGMQKAFSMTRQQLTDYLNGDMRLERALALARRGIENAKRDHERTLARDEAVREGLALADLSDDDWAPALFVFLQRFVKDEGPGADRDQLAEYARLVRKDLDKLEREHLSHKTRPGGDSGNS